MGLNHERNDLVAPRGSARLSPFAMLVVSPPAFRNGTNAAAARVLSRCRAAGTRGRTGKGAQGRGGGGRSLGAPRLRFRGRMPSVAPGSEPRGPGRRGHEVVVPPVPPGWKMRNPTLRNPGEFFRPRPLARRRAECDRTLRPDVATGCFAVVPRSIPFWECSRGKGTALDLTGSLGVLTIGPVEAKSLTRCRICDGTAARRRPEGEERGARSAQGGRGGEVGASASQWIVRSNAGEPMLREIERQTPNGIYLGRRGRRP